MEETETCLRCGETTEPSEDGRHFKLVCWACISVAIEVTASDDERAKRAAQQRDWFKEMRARVAALESLDEDAPW